MSKNTSDIADVVVFVIVIVPVVVTGSRPCFERLFFGVIRFTLLLENREHCQIQVRSEYGPQFDLCAHTLIKYLFHIFICLTE